MNIKKWIICAPVAFPGNEAFFSRDSGLCCRALQSLGADAYVVLPELVCIADEEDVRRASFTQLNNPDFWRQQDAQAVIFYSWGAPAYEGIARAITAGGLNLFINMDTGGLFGPFVEPVDWFKSILEVERYKRGFFAGVITAVCRAICQCFAVRRHLLRLRHLSCADVIGVVSPRATERIKKYVRFFGHKEMVQKVHFVPHPVDPSLKYNGREKQEKVIAVGRWNDWLQKRPDLLIDVVSRVLSLDEAIQFVIVGKDALRCVDLILARVPSGVERVVGYERLAHDQLSEEMESARISLCTSLHESFHIASGEALLCGCSIVAPLSLGLPAFEYFVGTSQFGRLTENTPEGLVMGILDEMNAWRCGERDAHEISEIWQQRISAEAVVRKIDELLSA